MLKSSRVGYFVFLYCILWNVMMILLKIIDGLETYKVQKGIQGILPYTRCELHALRNMNVHFHIKPGIMHLLWIHQIQLNNKKPRKECGCMSGQKKKTELVRSILL